MTTILIYFAIAYIVLVLVIASFWIFDWAPQKESRKKRTGSSLPP